MLDMRGRTASHARYPMRSSKSWTHPRRLRHTNRPDPQHGPGWQIQRSIRTGARALAEGTSVSTISPTTPCSTRRSGRSWAGSRPAPDPKATMETTEHFSRACVITAFGRTGRGVRRSAARPRPGASRCLPGPWRQKFATAPDRFSRDVAAAHLLERLLALDTVGPIALLSNIIAEGMKPAARRRTGLPVARSA